MNVKTEMLQNALPLICAGLGDKFDVKIKIRGDQASTDGTTITIPDFKVTTKEDKDAVLGFASHEAAHIKFKSFEGIKPQDIQKSPLRKSMWNIFEDLRIENAMIKSMIGTRKWIDQIWINRQKEGSRPAVTSESEPTTILFDYLLFSCRVKYRDQKNLQPYLDAATDAFIDTLGWKLQMELEDVLSEHLPKLDSSITALNLAKKVEQLINNHEPEEQSNSSDSDNSEDEEDKASNSNSANSESESSSNSDGNSESDNEDQSSDSNSNSKSESSSNSDGNFESDNKGQSSDSNSNSKSESLSNSDGNFESDSEGQSSDNNSESESGSKGGQPSGNAQNTPTADDVKQAIEALIQASDEDFQDDMELYKTKMANLAQANAAQSCISIPDVRYAKNFALDAESGKNLESEVKRNSNLLTAKLQGLVQENMRVRSKTSNFGKRINNRVLHRIATGDPRVFKSKAKKQETDTIVEVMIDNSMSMKYYTTSKGKTLISEARKAQLSLALALNKLEGVTVTASAFPANGAFESDVIELLSEGESVKKLASRLSVVCGEGGGTPSGSAMWHSIRKVIESKKQRKIILFITDGDPNPDQSETLKSLVRRSEKSGIIVIGIAIGSIADNPPLFYQYFRNAIFIQDAKELKTEMFKVAQNLITG